MSNVKRCDRPGCNAIDDNDRPVMVKESKSSLQYGSEIFSVAGDHCAVCHHELIELLSRFFPKAAMNRARMKIAKEV